MTFSYAIATLAGLVLAAAWLRPRRVFRLDSFGGLFLLVFALAYLIRPLLSWAVGDNELWLRLRLPPHPGNVLDKMAVANLLGLAAFAVSFRFIRERESNGTPAAQSDGRARRQTYVGLVFVAAGWLSIVLFNPAPFLRGEPVAETEVIGSSEGAGYTQSTAYLIQGNYFVIAGAALLYAATGRLRLTLVCLIPLIASRLWWGWGRQALLFAILVVWYLTVRRVRQGEAGSRALILPALLAIAVLSVFPVLAENRAFFRSLEKTDENVVARIVKTLPKLGGSASTIAGFEASAHWIHYTPDVFPYQYGNRYLYSAFLLPVPRMLWPEKRNIFAEWFHAQPRINTDYLYGAAPGVIGDAYQNFGFLGVLLFLSVTGALLAALERLGQEKDVPVRRAIGALGFCVTPLIVRSGLVGPAPLLFFFGLPFVVDYLAGRCLPPASGDEGQPVRLRLRKIESSSTQDAQPTIVTGGKTSES